MPTQRRNAITNEPLIAKAISLAERGGELTWAWADWAAEVAPINETSDAKHLLEMILDEVTGEVSPDLIAHVPKVPALMQYRRAAVVHPDLRAGLSVKAARELYPLRDDKDAIVRVLDNVRAEGAPSASRVRAAVGVLRGTGRAAQLRAELESLVKSLRRHPGLPDLQRVMAVLERKHDHRVSTVCDVCGELFKDHRFDEDTFHEHGLDFDTFKASGWGLLVEYEQLKPRIAEIEREIEEAA